MSALPADVDISRRYARARADAARHAIGGKIP